MLTNDKEEIASLQFINNKLKTKKEKEINKRESSSLPVDEIDN